MKRSNSSSGWHLPSSRGGDFGRVGEPRARCLGSVRLSGHGDRPRGRGIVRTGRSNIGGHSLLYEDGGELGFVWSGREYPPPFLGGHAFVCALAARLALPRIPLGTDMTASFCEGLDRPA